MADYSDFWKDFTAEHSDNAVFKNPPPMSAWQHFVQSIKDTFSEAGSGVNALILRGNQRDREEDLIRRRAQEKGMTPDQAEQWVQQNRAQGAQDIKEIRGQRAIRDEDDANRQLSTARRAFNKVADVAGAVVGDINPTYALPILGETVPERIIGQAAVGGADNMAVQAHEVKEGIRDKGDPLETAIAALAGAGFQSAGEAVVAGGRKASGMLRVRRGEQDPDYKVMVDSVIPDIESNFRADAVSPKGARGMMQVMPETARKPGHGIPPSNGTPADDIRVGRKLYAALLGKYGDHEKALAAYNWGEGHVDSAVRKYGDDYFYHMPKETQDYVSTGMIKAFGGPRSTGGPVAPMHPTDIASAMGEDLSVPSYDDMAPGWTDRYGNVFKDEDYKMPDTFGDERDDQLIPGLIEDQRDFNHLASYANDDREMFGNPNMPLEKAMAIRKYAYQVGKEPEDVIKAYQSGNFPGVNAQIHDMEAKFADHLYSQDRKLTTDNVVDLGAARDTKRVAKVLSDHQKINDVLDRHLDQAHDIQDSINDGDVPLTLGELKEEADRAASIRDSMPENHPLRYKAEELANMYSDMVKGYHADPIAEKAVVEDTSYSKHTPYIAEAPAPANDTSRQLGPNRGQEAKVFLKDKGFSNAALYKMPADRAIELAMKHGWEAPTEPLRDTSASKELAPEGQKRSIIQLIKDLWHDESGTLNLDKLVASEDVKKTIKETARSFDTAPGTHAGWVKRAQELFDAHGVTGLINLKTIAPEDLPAYSYALRSVNIQAQKKMVELSKAVLDESTSTPMVRDALSNARVLAAAAYERTNNISGVAGRLLNAHKMMVGKKGIPNVSKRIEQMIGNDVDPVRLAELIQQHSGDEDVLGAIAANSLKPKAEDYLFSVWFNMMLSGIKTHVANIVGNTGHILLDLMDHGYGYMVGKARTAITGGEAASRTELAARMHGMVAGAKVGLQNSKLAFKIGTPLDMADKLQTPRVFKGKASVLELPTRALAAEDEWFRNVATVSDLYASAVRQAKSEGLTGEDLVKRIEVLSANPTDKMTADAIEFARRMRFNDQPGRIAQGIETIRRRIEGDHLSGRLANVAVHMVIPFVRVLDRLTAATIRHLPIIGMLDRVNAADWKAGGARRDLVIGRMISGSGILAMTYLMADDGKITGAGPSDFRKRAQLQASGWQPYSVKIGDKYYSYNNIQPISNILGIAATEVEQRKEGGHDAETWDKTAYRHLSNVMSALLSGNFIQSLSGFIDSTSDASGTKFENWAANLAGSASTPAILRQVNQSYIDPKVRSTTGDGSLTDRVVGRIESGIPGLSDNLPQKSDVFGNPMKREGSLGPDIMSPLTETTENKDPVIQEVKRLSKEHNDLLVGPVSSTVKVGNESKKLNSKDYQSYQGLAGRKTTEGIRQAMNDPEWQFKTDDEKRKLIKKIVTSARKEARNELFSNDPFASIEGLFK